MTSIRRKIKAAYESFANKQSNEEQGKLLQEIARLEATLEASGQTYKEHDAKAILSGLGFREYELLKPLREFSGGWLMRATLSKLLLRNPDVLLLDEPTTGLDPVSKRQVQDLVIELQKEHDATILFVTHDMDEAEKLCDSIAIMSEGRIIATGSISELLGLAAEEGKACSLESAFMAIAGHRVDEAPEKIVSPPYF